MDHRGKWNKCILGFVKWVNCFVVVRNCPGLPISYMLTSLAPVKQPWWRWVNSSQDSTKKHNITKTNTENWESSRCQLKCRWRRRCHNGVDRWNSVSLKTKLASWPFWIFNESQHIKTVCIFYGIYCICGKCVAYSLESEYHSPLSRLTAIEWYWVLTDEVISI